MKSLIAFFFSILILVKVNAQTTYEKQIETITLELSKKIADAQKKRIAVADFTDLDGNVTKLGRFIAEELNTFLPEAGKGFEVIDRSQISKLMKENELLKDGFTDPKAAAQLGKLVGIEALIYGTIIKFGNEEKINIKVLDLQTAVIIRTISAKIDNIVELDEGFEEKKNEEQSSPDCEKENTCTFCITNNSDDSVMFDMPFDRYSEINVEDKLIHTGKTECWQNVKMDVKVSGYDSKVNSDYRKIIIALKRSTDSSLLSNMEIILEPCKIFNFTYTK